jgi:metallo-beta-lactamase family protein
MAISATEIHRRHFDYHKFNEFDLKDRNSIFDYKNIHYRRSQSESMQLNTIQKDAIIISASGMCTGGRILHHLYNRLGRENDTLLFVGYQAEGTRGRRILDGEPKVKMFGYEIPVLCHVEHIDGLSAHADKTDLLRWLGNYRENPDLTFVVHGEKPVSVEFAATINEKFGWKTLVPEYDSEQILYDNI